MIPKSTSKFILLNKSDSEIGNIQEFEYIHGKFDFSISPNFCGASTRSISNKTSDNVVFKFKRGLSINHIYKIMFNSGQIINIQIAKYENFNYYATVLKT